MKTTMKKLATGTLIALLLMAGNVKAEGTEIKASNKLVETTLQLENWMINEAIWNKTSFVSYEIVFATETGLQLENWMTSEKTWNLNNNFVEETETGLELKDWMTNEKIWNNFNIVEETETGLTVESWMTNENIW